MLDVHLALLRRENILVPFGIDEAAQAVALRKAIRDPLTVLPGAPGKICRGADVERTVRPVGHDIDPSAVRHRAVPEGSRGNIKNSWMAGRPATGNLPAPISSVDAPCR